MAALVPRRRLIQISLTSRHNGETETQHIRSFGKYSVIEVVDLKKSVNQNEHSK